MSYEVYLCEHEVKSIVKDLGDEIKQYCEEHNIKDLLVVGIMNGSLLFTADLIRHLNPYIEVQTIYTKSYINNSNEGNTLVCHGMDSFNYQNRTVLLVDDVYDSGNTMDWLRGRFKSTGAKEVLSCVLIDKLPGHPNKQSNIDFIGHIMAEKKFLVGYGMDDNKLYRNTNDILIKV